MNERKDYLQVAVERYYEACRRIASKYENISEVPARVKYAVARSIMRTIDFLPAFWSWDLKYDNTQTAIMSLNCIGYFIEGVAPELATLILDAIEEIKYIYALSWKEEE
jgi:hypothetical protein